MVLVTANPMTAKTFNWSFNSSGTSNVRCKNTKSPEMRINNKIMRPGTNKSSIWSAGARFANLAPADQMEDLFVPGLIILLLILISGLFVFLQRTFDVPEELKDQLNVFAVIGFAVTNTIPILTIVGLIMMIP